MPDQIQLARQFVQTIFQELNAGDEPLRETVLVRDDFYCGHQFGCNGLQAVWFCEENEIKVYDRQRKLIRVASFGDSTVRRAA